MKQWGDSKVGAVERHRFQEIARESDYGFTIKRLRVLFA